MKFLLDFLPIVAFFATYKWGEGHKDMVAQWLTQHLGFIVNGGVVGPTEAPVLLATVVVVVISVLQIVLMKAFRKPIDKMLWISLVTVVGLGALTVYFHSETFIKWKPTVIYWVMGGGLFISDVLMRKFVLRAAMNAADLKVPESVWLKLSLAWILFFVGMGVLNLHVAFNYPTDTWVNFKMWGSMGLMLVFTLAQGVYLSRHMDAAEKAAENPVKGA
jgi:intracellular septation protein